MAIVELVMPKLGESIMEATVLKWHKKPGDPVQQDETVLEIATDKVDSEVPSTAEGIIEEILVKENDVVSIGTVIAVIRTGNDGNAPDANQPAASQPEEPQEEVVAPAAVHTLNNKQPAAVGTNKFYSPLVLTIAANEGVALNELEKIPGTGNEGRVTKKDILHYVEQ